MKNVLILLLLTYSLSALANDETETCLPYVGCGFYKCMERKYQCAPTGVAYLREQAFPMCMSFQMNIQKEYFSRKAQSWIYQVMDCKQAQLVKECEHDARCSTDVGDALGTCEVIKDIELRFYPGCFINSGEGVCNLPMSDKINIWRTISGHLSLKQKEEAYSIVFYCSRKIRADYPF